MEYIINFFKNPIVLDWIAPIVTTLISTIILKKFTIINISQIVNKANQEYIDTILTYVEKKEDINQEFVHGIRKALAIELGVPEGKMYSDQVLKDILIYKITKNTDIAEKSKIELINGISNEFNENILNRSEVKKQITINKSNKKYFGLATILGFLICIIIYASNPEEASNPNSVQAFFLGSVQGMAMLGLAGFTWTSFGLEITIKKEE